MGFTLAALIAAAVLAPALLRMAPKPADERAAGLAAGVAPSEKGDFLSEMRTLEAPQSSGPEAQALISPDAGRRQSAETVSPSLAEPLKYQPAVSANQTAHADLSLSPPAVAPPPVQPLSSDVAEIMKDQNTGAAPSAIPPPRPLQPPPTLQLTPQPFQGGTQVSGTVSDATGARIPGVSVTATDRLTGAATRVLTNETGTYNFSGLQPGRTYDLTAQLGGFQTVRFTGVNVTPSVPQRYDFTLQVASVGQTVEVSVADSLRSSAASVGEVMTAREGLSVQQSPQAAQAGQRGGGGRGGRGAGGTIGRLEAVQAAAPPPPPPPPPGAGGMRFSAPTPPPPAPADRVTPPPSNTEGYDRITDNPFRRVIQEPLATFSIDVDTASYANVRRFIDQNQLPPKDAVRIEELINYFSYDYPAPSGAHPIAPSVEVAAAPWNPEHRLVRIGIRGKSIDLRRRPPSNLVFLIDVSGSMNEPNRLPLVISSMKLLVENLNENDRVAIVVYAGASGLALAPTSGSRKDVIMNALDNLRAGGSTNGGAGIQLAYSIAAQNFIRGGVNRVILATDGDFNVGVTNQGELIRLIEEKAKTGVFLSVLGFGMGNLKDSTLEKLADTGNGHYAYIDSLNEGRKVLVEEMSGTLMTIAKDVKIQIEFNPAQANAYRLIGYENRVLRNEDFNNDLKDAGDMGAGHTVTALFEVVPHGVTVPTPGVDPLKYQTPPVASRNSSASGELLNLKIRYKEPEGDQSRLIEVPLVDRGAPFARASQDFRFAASVAAFGMILRDSPYKGSASLDAVIRMAEQSKGVDRNGYRSEFVELVRRARALQGREQ